MTSYAGKFLRINLNDGKTSLETIPERVRREFLGGRGFGIKYLYDEVPAGINPLSPENRLLLLNGPLVGTKATSCSRWVVCTKSPLTGTVMRAVCGGNFGPLMRWAGLDFIIIEGKAEKPVYIYIDESGCQIRDAVALWGRDTKETQEKLEGIHGSRVGISCIGPAGENLVLYASVVSGRRTASRGGVGTVMGSKNLKAIAINATRKEGDFDQIAFGELVKEQIDAYKAEGKPAALFKYFSTYGTGSTEPQNIKGFFPVRNFQQAMLNGYQGLTHRQFNEMTTKHSGCYNCIIGCGKHRTVSSGPYTGATSEGPEYESIWAFTGSIDNNEIGSVIAADSLCDDLGLDTISTGVSIGFAFELFEKGLIDKEDTDGFELTWGNHAVLLPLIKKIAYREGFGDLLSKGTKRIAEQIGMGSIDYAMQVKGLELAAYDPRALKAMGFGFATSNIGGSQNYSYAFQEAFGVPIPRRIDPLAEEGKGDIVKFNQEGGAIMDSAVACIFPWSMGILSMETLGKLLAVATEIPEYSDPAVLMKVGERVCNLDRSFNVREGFDRKDDTLPKRILQEPIQGGAAAGQSIKNIDVFLDDFYKLCGWTRNGIPTLEKLKELNLEEVIKDIRPFI